MQSHELAQLATDALDELKALNVVTLDVRKQTSITDFMVIATGTSDRHVRSIADHVIEKFREAGFPALGVEGHEYGEWVLVDLGDVVVHVMRAKTRDFYKLENLWGMDDQAGQPTDSERTG